MVDLCRRRAILSRMLTFLARWLLCLVLVFVVPLANAADLRGHGGPVRGIALSPDGQTIATASFDSTVILWSAETGAARAVLRFHTGVVNAVIALPDGRFASAGEDGRIALWRVGNIEPDAVLEGHQGPVAGLAVSRDGAVLGSASWDGTARLWPLAGGAPTVLGDHKGNVNGLGFLPDGRVVTAGYDGAVRHFSAQGALLAKAELGAPANSLVVDADGTVIIAGADGTVRLMPRDSAAPQAVAVTDAPLVALALSPDGRRIAVAGLRGALAIIARDGVRIERRMEGPAFPLWSLAFSADGREVLTGGADRLVRRWSVATGEPATPVVTQAADDIPAALRDHPGAAVFRACIACHTLGADGANRAGPSLAGLYGRRIGSAPGYDYSPALRQLAIIWTPDSLQKLFEIGPAAYTPGTKMPEQTITRAEDRAALAAFLALTRR